MTMIRPSQPRLQVRAVQAPQRVTPSVVVRTTQPAPALPPVVTRGLLGTTGAIAGTVGGFFAGSVGAMGLGCFVMQVHTLTDLLRMGIIGGLVGAVALGVGGFFFGAKLGQKVSD